MMPWSRSSSSWSWYSSNGSPETNANANSNNEHLPINNNDLNHRTNPKLIVALHNLMAWAKSILPTFNVPSWSRRSLSNDWAYEHQLCKAASEGDWEAAMKIEEEQSGTLSRVINNDRQETALHIATRFNQAAFIKELVERLNDQDLASKNRCGNTALCIAATSGAVDIAKLMVRQHSGLALIRGSKGTIPLLIAAKYKNKNMVSYLLDVTPLDGLKVEEQVELLFGAISADYYDIALVIQSCNRSLALQRDINEDTPLHIMARKWNAIGTKNEPTKWQSYINSGWSKFMYRKTMMQIQAREMVVQMWNTVKSKTTSKEKLLDFIEHPSSMLHEAARVGNVEFLNVLLQKDPDLVWRVIENGKTILHVALENRQERVFKLIYEMGLIYKDDLLCYFDEKKISLLQLAAKKPDPIHLNRVSGAVFQMHRELLWFRDVESMVELTMTIKKGEQTPHELFTQEHRELKEEGEKWVKKTANSCMLIATLIATVVFTAAFTVPGAKNEHTGFPIFLHHKWFTVFLISDGIALISSSTSILLFLSILTSRCSENDFLVWLPLELVLGLGSLFLSVLGMVLAFGAALFLYYGKDTAWIPLLITGMAIVPIYWFGVLQWKLWADALAALRGSLHAIGLSRLLKNRKTKVF
ncbi:ankyrin repeat-containing protein At5g02620-like [Momordica charantia]|uniref:Ankyrin repeat-containing protein At5g02620-like n=1 Tax=Momordica charantia TaxID=3673 RepID=A0A6J1DZH7_MOMCH|nr:ankyrin repeat-containing protein At5g02620-like [Momordica charantia]